MMYTVFFHYLTPLKVFMTLVVLTTLMQVSFAQGSEPAFSTNDLFPGWAQDSTVAGVAGKNTGREGELFLGVVPTLIDLMIQFAAPVLFVMMVFAGLRFIYAQDNEEERNKAKNFFFYTAIGLMFILLSYSIMQAVYFIFAP